MNELIKIFAEKARINSDDRVQLLGSTLFIKIRNGYMATQPLIDLNYYNEVGYILRTIIESLFILRYLMRIILSFY